MIDPKVILYAARNLWEAIPEEWRDWSKSEVLNFMEERAPKFFDYCKNKLSAFWSRITNRGVRSNVDTATANVLSLNDDIPEDVKKTLFERITGSEYHPDLNLKTKGLTEIVQIDEEKKAAAMQMAYIIAVFGKLNKKQESMISEYMTSLRITEELKKDITNELQEAEREFAKFAEELRNLDGEFKRASTETLKAKKEANDIIDLI
jgi:hypothetical protein